MTKSEIDAILSRMEIRMAELGMSKEHFYELSGISSASFSQWNTGAHKPTKKKIGQAASVLGVSFEYLWFGEGQKEKPTTQEGSELTPKQRKAYNMIKDLPDDQMDVLIAMAEALVKKMKL